MYGLFFSTVCRGSLHLAGNRISIPIKLARKLSLGRIVFVTHLHPKIVNNTVITTRYEEYLCCSVKVMTLYSKIYIYYDL